jgi:hypothetical protein
MGSPINLNTIFPDAEYLLCSDSGSRFLQKTGIVCVSSKFEFFRQRQNRVIKAGPVMKGAGFFSCFFQ